MKQLYLIKIGEICLKKGNRNFFEKILRRNIRNSLPDLPLTIVNRFGRVYLECPKDKTTLVETVLSRTFGIIGFAKTHTCPKDFEDIRKTALLVADQSVSNNMGKSFKVNCRRIDKSFPHKSYEISCEIGGDVLEKYTDLSVDVKKPQWTIEVEIRENVYIYGHQQPGPGGLPVSTAGMGTLLLSGGIDSPVAGYLMAKRGLKLSGVHFHTPPFTSDEALDKVKELASILARYNGPMVLYNVPFTELQLAINKSVPPDKTTLHTRACMMKISEQIALKEGAECLITGEALSQVASQTLQSLHYTNSAVQIPVFRPCIGMDKEEIVIISRKADFFETSIRPFDDCCALFSPKHPSVRPDFDETSRELDSVENLESLIKDCIDKSERIIIRS